MKRLIQVLTAMLCLFAASPGFAQATRTWVSGVGDDANPCSRTAPCKTFAGAISKTATGGEINCLDPAGYGAVTITKSIIIDCNYTHGAILSANVNGIIINGAGAVVILRGLSINGATTTTGNGIRILNAAAVDVEGCNIENFGGTGANGRGISIETSAANTRINVYNSTFYNLNNDGINSAPTAGNVILGVDHVQMARGGDSGITLHNDTKASITNSSITNHATGAAISLELTTTEANIGNNVIANNAFGIFQGLGGAPTSRLFGNLITGSTSQAIQNNGGSVFTFGNNAIRGNAGNEAPTPPSLGLQ